MSFKKILPYILYLFLSLLYLTALISHLKKLHYGEINIITTFLFYLTIGLAFTTTLFLIRHLNFIKKETWANLILLTLTICFILFTTELFLKYGDGRHQTYQEKKGAFSYQSLYLIYRYENQLKQEKYREENYQLLVADPNSEQICKTNEYAYPHTFNEEGLRDKNWSKEKAANEIRIMAVGDSFTEGNGAAQDSTWLQFMERRLNNEQAPYKIKSFNAGKGGSDPVYGQLLFTRKLLKYHPDVLILTINSTDIGDIIIRGCQERFLPNNLISFRSPPWWEPIYGISYICRHILHDIFNANYMLLFPDQLEKEKQTALLCIKNVLNEYYMLSRKENFKLFILVHPLVQELFTDNNDYVSLQQLAAGVKADLKIDLKEAFLQTKILTKENLSDFYWPIDQHHTTNGYQLWGELLAERLINSDIL